MAKGESAATRTLIIAPSWIGDLVMAEPLVARLLARDPFAQVDAVAPPATWPLIERIPGIYRGFLLDVGHGELGFGRRLALARELRRNGYGRAIVLPNTFKAALVPWLAGIPRRTGWRGEMRYGLLNDLRVLDEKAVPLMADRYRALADLPGAAAEPAPPRPRLRVDAQARDAALAKYGLTGDRPVLALCPGAEFGPAKRWPARHFAAVAEHFIGRGWQVWTFGSGRDRAVTAEVRSRIEAKRADTFHDLAGQTSLIEAVDLLSCATAVLSNDSGLAHVANAVERRVWVIFGSSSPSFTPPLSDRACVLYLALPCSPCFERECPLGHLDCLNRLLPDRVLADMRSVLDSDSPQ